MPSEKQWVDSIVARLKPALAHLDYDGRKVQVESGFRLAYANEVFGYQQDNTPTPRVAGYQTDILISDRADDGSWTPRVVIEGKVGSVTTHDALTYSAKAATHKHVHPYLRYGIAIGALGTSLPPRLVRHGAYFDFMVVHDGDSPSESEWIELCDILTAEVRASREIQKVLDRLGPVERIRVLHRPLIIKR